MEHGLRNAYAELELPDRLTLLDGSIIVPDSMHLAARLGMEGAVHCRPETEGEGRRLEFGRRL